MLIVGAGSFVGGALRFFISYFMKSLCSGGFPWSTLLVNLFGCLLFGIIYGLFYRLSSPASSWCLLLTTGLCGGFTTFSTFAFEGLQMLHNGNIFGFITYASTSVFVGILLVCIGLWIVR
jgi:CrcB protein